MPEGFVYDTEPASRAVVTMADLSPDKIFPYFKSIQSAFYVGQKDVTNADTLAELATQHDVTVDEFSTHFQTDEVKKKTHQHFYSTHQAGVRGFPSLALQKNTEFELIPV